MRIFSIFFHPGVNFTALGGAERRFFEVLKIWIKKGVEITIVYSDINSLDKQFVNCEMISLSSPLSYRGENLLFMYLKWFLWIFRACLLCPLMARKREYDVILSPNNTLPILIVTYFTHLISRLPLCVVVHHMDFPFRNTRASFWSVYRLYRKVRYSRLVSFVKTMAFFVTLSIIKRSDTCIAVSKFTANFLVINGVLKDKIFVNGNGVKVDYIDSIKVEEGKIYDGIFVGRIARDKGIFDLIESWKKLVAKKSGSKLVVIGSGPDFSELKKTIESIELGGTVIIKGRCSDESMYHLMKASRVFILPSLFEGWGISVAEALACGLPVICYDIPALREVFSECDSVFFVKPGDVNMLTEVIMRVLECGDLKKIARVSQEFVRRFDWGEVAVNDLQIIRKMLSNWRLVRK